MGSTNEALAQVGFIVVAFNHRGGLPLRGREYHSFGYNSIRDHALADDKCGLEQLIARHSFIDGDRVGIYGHSGGGMMSTAGFVLIPIFIKHVYHRREIMIIIFTRNFCRESLCYRRGSEVIEEKLETKDGRDSVIMREKTFYSVNLPTNMELAKNLKGHLMLIVGGMDGNVHPVQTIPWWMLSLIMVKMWSSCCCHAGGTRMMGFLPGILRISCVRILQNICWGILSLPVFMILK